MNGSKKKRRGPFLWALLAICILGHASFPGPAGVFAASYDLLVIAPEEYAVPLNALVAHKNATGLPAVLLTLESIYRTFAGVDQSEKIKRAIRSYEEHSSVKYVMLVGDVDKLPVRWVTSLLRNDPSQVDYYFPSDLYYADLYDTTGAFSTWNFDGDAYFGEHMVSRDWASNPHSVNVDRMDFHPDVAVGRVPASTIHEVDVYVAKVIRYEHLTSGTSWFDNVLLLAGSGRNCDPGVHFAEIQNALGPGFSYTSYLHNSYDTADEDHPMRPCTCQDGETEAQCDDRTKLTAEQRDIFLNKSGDIVGRPDPAFANVGFLAYHNHTSPVGDYVNQIYNAGRFTIAFSDGCGDGGFAGAPPGEIGRSANTGGAGGQNLCYRTGGRTLGFVFQDHYRDTDGDGEDETYYEIVNCVVDGTYLPLAGDRCGGGFFPSMTFASDLDASGSVTRRTRPYILNPPVPEPQQPGCDFDFNPETKLFARSASSLRETGWIGLVAATKGADFPANGEMESLFFRGYRSPHPSVGGRNRLGDMWRSMLEYWLEEVVFTGSGEFFLTDYFDKYHIGREWYEKACAGVIQHAMMYSLFGDPSLRVGGVPGLSDTLAPTTAAEDGGIFGGAGTVVSVPFTATDHGSPPSGVRETRYRINRGSWATGDRASIPVSGDPRDDGYRTIEYYSIDYMGNQEPVNTATVGVDTYPPATSVLLNGEAPGMVVCACICPPGLPCDCSCPPRGCYIDGVTVTLSGEDRAPAPRPAPAEPTETWSNTFGGAATDEAMDIRETPDGGFILAGHTDSAGAGERDAWLIKTDVDGNLEWERTFGGERYDRAYSVGVTADGGYALAGYTTPTGSSNSDAWLVKTDGAGSELWSRTFGGSRRDEARAMKTTSDGGFVLAGFSDSFGTDGSRDVWLIRAEADGTERWAYAYGGSRLDQGHGVAQTADGGFIIAGFTSSFGAGGEDAYLVKTDAGGVQEWSATFGGTENDRACDVQQTSDGGYIIAGWTDSFGSGSLDLWLIKTDLRGVEEWSRTFGSAYLDGGYSVAQTSDGGYIVAGFYTSSMYSGKDLWLIKTDSSGVVEWRRTFGGSREDYANAVRQTSDGGYIAAGRTESYGAGQLDAWLLKVEMLVPPPPDMPVAGLARTEYYLNHWPWMRIPTEYTGPFTVGQGNHRLYYRSQDLAGNTEPYKQTSFCVNDFEAGIMREEARMLAALKEVIALRLRKDFASTLPGGPITRVRFDYGAPVGQGEPDWVTIGTDMNGDDGWGIIWDTVAAKIPDGEYLIRMTAYGPGGLKPLEGSYPLQDEPIYKETLTVTVCNIPDAAYVFELSAPAEVARGESIEYAVLFENRAEQPLSNVTLVCDLDPGLFDTIAVQDNGSLDGRGRPWWYKKDLQKDELWKVHFVGTTQKDIPAGTLITAQCMVSGDAVAQLLSDNPATQQEKDFTAVSVKPVNGVFYGTVADASTSEPLSATVTATGPKQYMASTDPNGQFNLEDLIPGTYTLSVSAPGYMYSAPSGPVDLPVDGTGKTLYVDFFMALRDDTPPVSALGISVHAVVEGNHTRLWGTAYDEVPGSGVHKVEVRVERRNDRMYWNGADWGKEETWLSADGTAEWTCDLGGIAWGGTVPYAVATRATDNAGNVESPRVHMKTARLAAPTLLSPPDGAVVAPGETIEWSRVIESYYRIQIDNDMVFGSPETNSGFFFENTATVPSLGQGRYYWRVRAMDWERGEVQSPWSEIRTFTLSGGALPEPGDLDGNGRVDLGDCIWVLKVLSRMEVPASVPQEGGGAAVKIGLEHAIYVLQMLAGLRYETRHSVSECKEPGDPNYDTDSERFDAEVVDCKLIVRHIDGVYNCCIEDIAVSVTVSDQVIELYETEILSAPCDCRCPYDITTEIFNLPPGVYTVQVRNERGFLGAIKDVVVPECPVCRDNTDCSEGFYCSKQEGDCDGLGRCSPKPQACITLWDPVCACDGGTYGNACDASASGTSVAHRGPCESEVRE